MVAWDSAVQSARSGLAALQAVPVSAALPAQQALAVLKGRVVQLDFAVH